MYIIFVSDFNDFERYSSRLAPRDLSSLIRLHSKTGTARRATVFVSDMINTPSRRRLYCNSTLIIM